METLAATVRHIPFFSGLSREDLARIVGKLEEERFPAGEVIVKQGQIGDALYIVQSGAVEVVLEHDGLRVESVAILGPHECFGEMSLFTGQRRSATVLALLDSVVLKLRKETWEELLAQHPSLSLHFCKVLSQRLAETDLDISRSRGSFYLAMEDFFSAQPPAIQDFLLRTSILRKLDAGAIRAALPFPEADPLLAGLSSSHPVFLRVAKDGHYEYLDYLRDFLAVKLEQSLERKERDDLHLRFAAHFAGQSQWGTATYHYIKAESWEKALELLNARGDEILESEPPGEIIEWLEALPLRYIRARGHLTRLRAEAHVRLGDLDAAIRAYQEFLAKKEISLTGALETAGHYQELAGLHHKKGEIGEALGCLRLGLTVLEEGKANMEAVEAMNSVGVLQQMGGYQEEALRWGGKAIDVAKKLGARSGSEFLAQNKRWLGLLLTVSVALGLWQIPPPSPLDESGVRFLTSLGMGLILWAFHVLDEYVVAIILLFVWIVFGIIPSEMALSGFSKSSWFFVLGVLGIGAAVIKSGLLYRVALQVLSRSPRNYKFYTLLLAASGLLVTPLITKSQGRLAIIAPLSQAISESLGFQPRSNGSAGLALSAYMGFSQMSFMFLTGSTACLIGLNLLPEPAKSEFGWGTWTLAAFPAGIFILLTLFVAIHLLFRNKQPSEARLAPKTVEAQLEILGPLTAGEWLSLAVLALVLLGWLAKPLHGISEAWIALGALSVFFVSGVMDKNSLKNNIDWGYLLFLGVLSSLTLVIPHLKVDRWIMGYLDPVVSAFSFGPTAFLMTASLLVYLARFFLSKTTTVIVLTLGLTAWAQEMEIHPGVLLLAILMGVECWFLPHQTDSYQIAYYSTDGRAFSHGQGRKLMVVKFFATFLAIAISVPYWRMLGFIR